MKLARLVAANFRLALGKLSAQPMPLRAAFRLKEIVSKIDAAAARFEEVRRAGLEKYGSRDERSGRLIVAESGAVSLTQENLARLADELNELGSMEVEVGSLSIAELGDEAMLSADDLAALGELLTQ